MKWANKLWNLFGMESNWFGKTQTPFIRVCNSKSGGRGSVLNGTHYSTWPSRYRALAWCLLFIKPYNSDAAMAGQTPQLSSSHVTIIRSTRDVGTFGKSTAGPIWQPESRCLKEHRHMVLRQWQYVCGGQQRLVILGNHPAVGKVATSGASLHGCAGKIWKHHR